MAKRALNVGSIVRFPPIAAATTRRGAAMCRSDYRIEYRIEQLVRLECGTVLYKIKSETEPFDRIVDESDLAAQP
jgi:hypothetical protein